MKLPGLLNQARLSFSAFWTGRNGRERTMLNVAALVAIFGLLYAVLVDPALSGREQLNKNLPVLRQQVAQMQALSKQAAALSEKSVVSLGAMSKENIEAALTRNDLQPQSVLMTGDDAKVQLSAVSFSAMLNWLDEMQKTARVSVTDANIIALTQVDRVNATLTLRQHLHE